eukprot:UN00490
MSTSRKEAKKSLYERYFGSNEAALDVVVDAFYGKILSDSLLQPFFVNSDMAKLRRGQKRFLMFAFGGPGKYSSRVMYYAHTRVRNTGNGINEKYFNRVVEHLVKTLKQFKIAQEDIDEVGQKLLTVKDDVLGIRKPVRK